MMMRSGRFGVYPPNAMSFPIGKAMNKSLTMKMGNCHHRRYIPHLVELTRTGAIDPSKIVTQLEPMSDALEAFRSFDRRERGWVKVELVPGASGADLAKETSRH